MDVDNLKKWAPFAAAGVLGLAAGGLGYTLVSRPPQLVGQPIERAAIAFDEIVVAARPLVAGAVLTEADLTLARIARESRPQTAFGDPALLTQGESGPRVVTQRIAAGQPVMQEHLAPQGTAGGLTAFLPDGYRAMSINVQPDTGLQGLLKPDAHVDIVAALRGEGALVVRTIAQNVRVLAVNGRLAGQGAYEEGTGEQLRDEKAGTKQVTLMVTPEQAGRLELAVSNGSPRLMLRAGSDRELTRFEGLTLAELRGNAGGDIEKRELTEAFDPWEEPAVPPASIPEVAVIDPREIEAPLTGVGGPVPTTRPATHSPEPKGHVIEVIRGGTVSREVFRNAAGDADEAAPPDPTE